VFSFNVAGAARGKRAKSVSAVITEGRKEESHGMECVRLTFDGSAA